MTTPTKKTLKAKDIERLENTSIATLLGTQAHTHEGLEEASPLCCTACSVGTLCVTLGGVCCTGISCSDGCTGITCAAGACTSDITGCVAPTDIQTVYDPVADA